MKSSALETPMMRQYLSIKAQQPDSIVFYRMGDFYEMFLADAELAAPLLDIALTTRDKGKPDAVPMCGVPVHSAEQHIRRLAELGHRVAICEQVEDPKQTQGRRLVRREVVEVVTPGLVGDPAGLDGRSEVLLVALDPGGDDSAAGLASLDASTGDFRTTRIARAAGLGLPELVWEELARIAPRELLLPEAALAELRPELARRLPAAVATPLEAGCFDPAAVPVRPEGFDAVEAGVEGRAAAALLQYLGRNQPFALSHVPRLRRYELGDTMVIDAATRSHLELFASSEDGSRQGTLIGLLDQTRTALGARRLARWLAYPLQQPEEVRARQEGVAWLAGLDRPRARLREALAEVRDLERMLARAARPSAVPRDLGQLRASISALPAVVEALAQSGEDLFEGAGTRPGVVKLPTPLPELARLLWEGLIDEPPVIAKGSRGAGETGYIRTGFRAELDALRESASKGREWIAGLELRERQRSGINSLKVRYHPVHGYSLEVPKSQLEKVPGDFIRKQTLAGVERYTTEELGEMESRVIGASERAAACEREVLESLRGAVIESAAAIRAAAEAVAELDALAALAEVARREGWVRPEIDAGDALRIRAGRHPVVESVLRTRGGEGFVPNDSELDCGGRQILLLTGPNMSGKSTYLRQVALIVLLAQMGSFVPAEAARIGVVDRIFTRVGASDRLARGESTFMVEMRETAEILRLATRRSLVILDEIGRGTSTFDGLSIAWAVAEYLHDTPGLTARTLFATHYHELIDLAQSKPRLVNAHFEVREWRDEVVFLRRLVAGGASRSYGIQVAQLAGLPQSVVARAREILKQLEAGAREPVASRPAAEGAAAHEARQLALALQPEPRRLGAAQAEVLAELGELDPARTTPIDALLALARWQQRLRAGEGES